MTTSREVRRGGTTSRHVCLSIINPESKANYLCVVRLKSLGD